MSGFFNFININAKQYTGHNRMAKPIPDEIKEDILNKVKTNIKYREISKIYDISMSSVSLIAHKNGIIRKVIKYPGRKKIPDNIRTEVLKHIKTDLKYSQIGEMFDISSMAVSTIARENGIIRSPKKLNKEQAKILKSEIQENSNYTQLAIKYGVSRQYISLIAKTLGFNKKNINEEN